MTRSDHNHMWYVVCGNSIRTHGNSIILASFLNAQNELKIKVLQHSKNITGKV